MISSVPQPFNVHISNHPCVRAKLSQLRSKECNARETKALIHEIALIVGCEALGTGLQTIQSGTVSLLYFKPPFHVYASYPLCVARWELTSIP